MNGTTGTGRDLCQVKPLTGIISLTHYFSSYYINTAGLSENGIGGRIAGQVYSSDFNTVYDLASG